MSGAQSGHYPALFADIARVYGACDGPVVAGVVDLSAGGLVSIRRVGAEDRFVTCELSMYPQQIESAEGLRFELLSLVGFDDAESQRFLTAMAALSMKAQLGHGHTIDVATVFSIAPFTKVQLRLESECEIGGRRFGVYAVLAA